MNLVSSNILLKRAFSFSLRTMQQPLNVEIISSEPLNKKQTMIFREYFELYHTKEGQKLDMSFDVNKYLGPNELEIMVDKKKMTDIPNNLQMLGGKALDTHYVSPPGKPKGSESRLFSNVDSPVYQGVARKLGYKPRRGFQHP